MLAALTLLGGSASALTLGDRGRGQNITFPDTLLVQNGGPVLDVRRPPQGVRAARGDGRADDTAAFQDVYDFAKRQFQEHTGWGPENVLYVYLPDGAYKVSDTLIYRGPTVGSFPKWDGRFDFNHVRFVGQSRARTVLRLADRAPGFGDPSKPKIVLAFQHPDTIFNNLPGGNYLRNVTIDTGRGNPGAVGVFFQGANQTDIRNVTIRSEDGQGRYGLWFKQGSIQGYYTDVTIDGFDDGIFDEVNAEGDVAFEYLTLRDQRHAGFRLSGGGASLRGVLSDQTSTGVPALLVDGSGPQAVLLDSALQGGKAAGPAIVLTRDAEQVLFARDVSATGYAESIQKAGFVAVPGAQINEYVSSPPKTLFPGTPAHSLRLPVRDTPAVPWFDPKQWAIVDDYPSVQAAFDSGRPLICFKKRHYKLTGDVIVPPSVRFVNGMGAGAQGGALVVRQASPDPLLVQDADLPIRVEARRDVIQRCSGGGLSNPQGLPVTFYLENVNDDATGDDFCRPGATIYARQIDIEYGGGHQIVCNGGTFWILGFKTENMAGAPFTVKNGGQLEILGGYCNATNRPPPDKQHPIIENDASRASATLFTNLGGPFEKAVVETQGGQTVTASNTDFPKRGAVYRSDYVIPLYVGGPAR